MHLVFEQECVIELARVKKTAQRAGQMLFVAAGSQMRCGVGQFAGLLSEAIEKLEPGRCKCLTLTRSEGTVFEIWRHMGSARHVIVNFPIVAWKRVIFRPLLVSALARVRGRRVVLIQHEWASLHPLRRITYIPALLLAHTIVMFSPLVRRELAEDKMVGFTVKKCRLAPLPPNIECPVETADSKLRQRLATERDSGRLVIGQFGSIYPGKCPDGLLEICAILKERGRRPLVVHIGSFIRGHDDIEKEFFSRVAELGLSDDVIVSGYVESNQEIFGLFSQIDVFCYKLPEGVTARRASILACVQSGRPVVIAAPAMSDEFEHHPRFKELIDCGAVMLVAERAENSAYADAIISALERPPPVRTAFDFNGWWVDLADSVRQL